MGNPEDQKPDGNSPFPLRVLRPEDLQLERLAQTIDKAAVPQPYPRKMVDQEIASVLDRAAASLGWLIYVTCITPPPADAPQGSHEATHNQLVHFLKHTDNYPVGDYDTTIAKLAEMLHAKFRVIADGTVGEVAPAGIEDQQD